MATAWQTIGVWSAAAFLAVVALTFLARPMAALANNAVRIMRQSPLSALVGALFLAVFVVFAGEKPTPPEPPPAPPERQPWPEASEWERIDIDAEHTTIENEDKSRRNAAIPVETEGDVVVPDVLKLHRVVSIGTRAFDGCSRITSVDIPEGVTNIADYAFYNCSALTNVVFPSTLKSIGAYAFVGCGKLKQVHIEVPRLTIGERAFRDCDGLQTIQFVGDELRASTRAFFGCGGLRDVNLIVKDITLSEGVFSGGYDPYPSHYGYCDHLTNVIVAASNRVEFGVSVFAGCSALQQVMLTAGAEMDIGSTVFSGCTALRQAALTARSGMKVGASAFSSCWYNDSSYSSCNHLTNVLMVASNRVELGASVFSGCTALQAIELPEGLVGLPTNALAYCTSLQSVSLSSNVASIAYRAFDTCTSLTNVWLREGLSVIESQAFYGCALKRLELPQSVSSVGSRAFEKCGDLKSVLVREGDTNRLEATTLAIGERAFYRCDALVTVRLPQRATVLPARVFADCECLASINLPSNLTDIAESAFESCAALPYVDFPESLASIGAMAFNSCAALTGFSIPTNRIVDLGDKAFVGTKYWNEWPDNSLVENSGYILGFKGNPTSVELPEGCVAIPAEMFMGMTALTNVVVPASVKKVGLRAFAGSGLLTVALPSVTELGVSAFEGCVNLTAVVLAEGLGEIPNLAFHGCVSLLAIDIPESVRSIGAEAFRDCAALQDVTGGEGVERVGDYAFAGCVSLQPFRFIKDVAYGEHVYQGVRWTENVLMPSVGTMAQEYPESYREIRSIVISSSQTNIVDGACAGCGALESVVIPSGVKSIGARAFEGCSSLTSLALSASVVNVGSNAFNGCASVIALTTSGQVPASEILPESYGKLTSVRIASEAESLCDEALAGCVAMVALDIPSTVTDIGAAAFSGCTGLVTLTLPSRLTSIGDYAFKNCTKLQRVNFMGPQPSANPNIYAGTSKELWSKVRLVNKESWTTDGKMLPARWPAPQSVEAGDYANTRKIGWWTDAPKDAPGVQIEFFHYNTTGAHPKMSPEEGFAEEPEREGYDFLGWWTKPYGGVQVTEENYKELGVTAVYAHWVRNREDHDDPQGWDDVIYDVKKAHVYDGYLMDGDEVVGTVQVKPAKGKVDKKSDEMKVNVTASVLMLGEGKKVSFKGVAVDVDESGGSADLVCTKKSDGREMSVSFTPNGLEGNFDGFEIVGARNMFGEKTDWDKRTARATIDDWGGTYAVVLESEGDSPLANGIVVLTVKVATKGKCKVSGTMPDGTKVSVSSQLQILHADAEAGVTACELPVVVPLYSGKKGGFGFCIEFSPETEAGVEVVGLTEWLANPGKTDEFTATLMPLGMGVGTVGSLTSPSVFMADTGMLEIPDVFVDDSLLPGFGNGVAVTPSGKKWTLPKADKVKFNRETETYDVTTDFGNPAGLKLTFTASSGTFKGSFKVYTVTETGKSKIHTAQVTGAVVDGVGYGTAIIKKVCSMPVVIQPEE